jgi:hypothetical protein
MARGFFRDRTSAIFAASHLAVLAWLMLDVVGLLDTMPFSAICAAASGGFILGQNVRPDAE